MLQTKMLDQRFFEAEPYTFVCRYYDDTVFRRGNRFFVCNTILRSECRLGTMIRADDKSVTALANFEVIKKVIEIMKINDRLTKGYICDVDDHGCTVETFFDHEYCPFRLVGMDSYRAVTDRLIVFCAAKYRKEKMA